MSTNSTGSILVRRGPTADRLLFCPLPGEIIYDTILKQLFVGDGVTLGGIAVGTGGGGSGGATLHQRGLRPILARRCADGGGPRP